MPQYYTLYTKFPTISADEDQLIFINQSKNRVLDDYFRRNLDKVQHLFHERGKQFIFIPELLTKDYVQDLLQYNIPNYSETSLSEFAQKVSANNFYDQFINYEEAKKIHLKTIEEEMGDAAVSPPYTGLVYSDKHHSISPLTNSDSDTIDPVHYSYTYNLYSLEEGDDEQIWQQLLYWNPRSFCFYHKDNTLNTAINPWDSEHSKWTADNLFNVEAYKLSQEIIERVNKLRLIGVNEIIIRGLLEAQPQLSPLWISKDFRLFLPDYQNREIVMSPLVKAVYMLFLNHKDGIMFKEMDNYRGELSEWYSRITNREPDIEMRRSIAAICDPLNNSLNEKCSRIREAFLSKMGENIARHYYITGKRATPKGIILDRKLVSFEGGMEQSYINVYNCATKLFDENTQESKESKPITQEEKYADELTETIFSLLEKAENTESKDTESYEERLMNQKYY